MDFASVLVLSSVLLCDVSPVSKDTEGLSKLDDRGFASVVERASRAAVDTFGRPLVADKLKFRVGLRSTEGKLRELTERDAVAADIRREGRDLVVEFRYQDDAVKSLSVRESDGRYHEEELRLKIEPSADWTVESADYAYEAKEAEPSYEPMVPGPLARDPLPDPTTRKLVFAHYVSWETPEKASVSAKRFYDLPVYEYGKGDIYREEIERAMAMGIDGFSVEMMSKRAHRGYPAFHEAVARLLQAAEGLDFYVMPCLDSQTDVDDQVDGLVKALRKFGNHPNYPRVGHRYVICTFTYRDHWTQDDWRQIYEGCEKAGCPIYVIGNVKLGFGLLTPKILSDFKGCFDAVYSFAYVGMENKSVASENAAVAAWCRSNAVPYMASIHPGYFGSWLCGNNASYWPHRCVDKFMRDWDSIRQTGAEWIHLTTWNDNCETTLAPMRLTPGNRWLVRAVSDEFKGLQPSAERADAIFAYRREEMVGTMMRFEAMRLPSREPGEVVVGGRLRDPSGNIIASLEPQKLTNAWQRVEWLVKSAEFSHFTHVTPEFAMKSDSGRRHAMFPSVLFATPYLENPVTVKETMRDAASVESELVVKAKGKELLAKIAFNAPSSVRRAILYRNGRPLGQFAAQPGGVVDRSGADDIDLNVRDEPTLDKEGGSFELRLKSFRRPCASDAFQVVFELADGTFSESQFAFPFVDGPKKIVKLPVLETATSIESDNAVVAYTKYYEFLTPKEKLPLQKDEIAVRGVARGAVRGGYWPLEHDGRNEWGERHIGVAKSRFVTGPDGVSGLRFSGEKNEGVRMPARMWPMDSASVEFEIAPENIDGVTRGIIRKPNAQPGFSLKMTGDGCLEATWSGKAGGFVWAETILESYKVVGRTPLKANRWNRIRLTHDYRTIRIYVDGKLDGEAEVKPFRAYAPNFTVIGGDAKDSPGFRGWFKDLVIGPIER